MLVFISQLIEEEERETGGTKVGPAKPYLLQYKDGDITVHASCRDPCWELWEEILQKQLVGTIILIETEPNLF